MLTYHPRIDTQDTLLKEKKVENIIEIGPSSTLTGITKQTVDTKYRDHDIALSIQRRLQSTHNDSDDIYHIVDSVHQNPAEKKVAEDVSSSSQPKVNPDVAVAIIPLSIPTSNKGNASIAANSAFPDAPVTAEAILKTVIAQKLKRGIEDISVHSSIKTLVAGMEVTLAPYIAY